MSLLEGCKGQDKVCHAQYLSRVWWEDQMLVNAVYLHYIFIVVNT